MLHVRVFVKIDDHTWYFSKFDKHYYIDVHRVQSLLELTNLAFGNFRCFSIISTKIVVVIAIASTQLKPCTHDQICIRMQILQICKICVHTQIWSCVRIYSRMQNLHVCKSWKICTCLRPSANLILRIRKICVYANLVM